MNPVIDITPEAARHFARILKAKGGEDLTNLPDAELVEKVSSSLQKAAEAYIDIKAAMRKAERAFSLLQEAFDALETK
jgi:hypothetical protein